MPIHRISPTYLIADSLSLPVVPISQRHSSYCRRHDPSRPKTPEDLAAIARAEERRARRAARRAA